MGFMTFWDWFLRFLHLDRETREAGAALATEIEHLVQEVSPAIRNVRGYRRQLRGPVEKAKKYIEGLVAAIPGPLPLSAADWGRGSPAELLFIDANQVRELFENSTVVNTFFQQEAAPQTVALLTATRSEKTIFVRRAPGANNPA